MFVIKGEHFFNLSRLRGRVMGAGGARAYRRPLDCKYRARGRLKTKKQDSKPQNSELRGRPRHAAARGHVALFDKGRALEWMVAKLPSGGKDFGSEVGDQRTEDRGQGQRAEGCAVAQSEDR